MRIFAAISPDNMSARTAVPAEILQRLAFGRPRRSPIQPAMPVPAHGVEPVPAQRDEVVDLDQRVRQSGEW